MFSLKIKFGTYFSFLQRAANLTSSLLNNVNKIPIRNLSINILVSGAKLEKFAVQYAQYHWGLRNNSKAEMSIEMDEVGKRFLVRVRGPPGGGGGGKLKKVFHWEYPPPGTWSSFSWNCWRNFCFSFSSTDSRLLTCRFRYTALTLSISVRCLFTALAAMKIPAGNKEDVIFPSTSAESGKNFIREEKNAVTLPASLFSYQGLHQSWSIV